jgi:hypothetical protein
MHFLSLALSFQSVIAHFDLITPPATRGVNLDTSDQAPCGGFGNPSNRVEFPIMGGSIKGKGYHKNSTIFFKLAIKENPSKDDFVTEFHPRVFTLKSGPFELTTLDFSKINGIKNDIMATLQVYTFDSHDYSYQCIDVLFKGKDTHIAIPKPENRISNSKSIPSVTSATASNCITSVVSTATPSITLYPTSVTSNALGIFLGTTTMMLVAAINIIL